MDIRNTFLAGKMNLDADHRIIPQGEYRESENIRVANSEGSDVGAIEKSLSNKKITTLSLGSNVYTMSSLRDEFEEKLYWAVLSDNGCYIIEHEVETEITTIVLEDTRSGTSNVLGFVPDKRLQMALIVDTDNGNRLLAFTDNNTQPKLINVERAKTYGTNGFNEEMILLIKKPPLFAPTIVLSDTGDDENNIEEKFLTVFTRHKYLDGEYSALSPSSDFMFQAKPFRYDYSTGTNESMLNAYNQATISFDTGSDLVTDVEIIFKQSGSNTLYLIETLNKTEESWADNTTESIDFSNNKIYRALPEKELYRLYDNVPLLAKALAVINNRLVFGQYTENYDLIDDGSNKVIVDLTVEHIATAITIGVPTKSMKSNRDDELAIAYLDDYGRMTTPLTSLNNSVHIPTTDCINQNTLRVTVANKAPEFAKYYRFFIKQNKTDYESISPIIFYQDGSYRWIKLENSDKDKIKEGDQLVVKSDSSQILPTLVKTRVLEVSQKEQNFLQPEDIIDSIKEKAGLYFKIKPDNFRINTDDFENFSFNTYHNARRRYHDVLHNPTAVVYPASWYGDTLDDMTSGGTCTLGSMVDQRYIVQIDATGTPDSFKWSDDNGDNWTTGVLIDGTAQSLGIYGITVTFGATTGHSLIDQWEFFASGPLNSNDEKAYGWFRINGAIGETLTSAGLTTEDEVIENGAVIDITYDEWNRGDVHWEINNVSGAQYDNIIEWYYKEDIGGEIVSAFPGFDLTRIHFMRCVVYDSTAGNAQYSAYDTDGFMTMVIESQNSQNSTEWVYVSANTELFQSDGSTRLLFETDPIEDNLDIFYEIGRTYSIDSNGNHLSFDGGDTDQVFGTNDAVLNLPVYNCYSWGNAFESYKIKDFFNSKSMKMDTRPSTPIENYRQNKRISSFTYSNVYEQSTNYNALNEFNLSLGNFKDLDDRYGAIQAMISWNNDLDVWQEDKVHKVLYDKTVIYNKDGSGNLSATDKILNDVVPYSGEFGISIHPESLVAFGNYTYWADAKRGMFLRKGQSGIEIISNFGIRDWTRDAMTNLTTFILGCYDPYFGQYVVSLNGKTLTFDEKVKGWTSFHSWIPDEMVRVNNRFFTIKDGQLYLHNATDNGINNFYETQYTSKIKTVFNQEPQTDKLFKTIVTESDGAWKATITTNLTNSSILRTEFANKESRWYGYIRQNEDSNDLRGVSQGVGRIELVSGSDITFTNVSGTVSIGDNLYQMNGSNQELIGVITGNSNNILTVSTIVTTPVVGYFCFSKKDSRINGSSVRGYYMEVELEDDTTDNNELFAVSSNVVKSYL